MIELICRIRDFAQSQRQLPYAPVSEALAEQAEEALGFAIPELPKACYTRVGNGGFGPAYEGPGESEAEIINPFTGEQETIFRQD